MKLEHNFEPVNLAVAGATDVWSNDASAALATTVIRGFYPNGRKDRRQSRTAWRVR